MVGQVELLSQIDMLTTNKKFPKFSVIIGEPGYGKHELCKYIASKLNIDFLLFNNKMEDMRLFINTIKNQASPYLYILQEGDSMAVEAKNSMLKIVEEVPNYAYIILLINNRNSALATILSRAFCFELNNYSKRDLLEYARLKDYKNIDNLVSISSCPGEVNSATSINVDELIIFASNIIDKMQSASLPNALKLSSTINGGAGSKYDFKLFLNSLLAEVTRRIEKQVTSELLQRYRNICSLISTYSYRLRTKANNLKYTVDDFIINLWRILG